MKLPTFPWRITPADLTFDLGDLTLLHRMYSGRFGEGRGVVYSQAGRPDPSVEQLVRLHRIGVVEFYSGRQMGWDQDMWGARLTCVGMNAVFRHDGGSDRQSHPGCHGYWAADGVCDTCSAVRPLDAKAYAEYLVAARDINPFEAERQANGPQLYCIEHGFMRRIHITTTKVCRLPGTEFHDGGLARIQ